MSGEAGNNEGESVSSHFQKELADPKFHRLYEVESKKVRLGFVINRLRNQARLTEAELGRRAGVTKAYIARLEMGELRNYDLDTLKKIAMGLHKVLVIGFADESKTKSFLQPKDLKASVAL